MLEIKNEVADARIIFQPRSLQALLWEQNLMVIYMDGQLLKLSLQIEIISENFDNKMLRD